MWPFSVVVSPANIAKALLYHTDRITGVMGAAVLEGWLKNGSGYTFAAHTRTEASINNLKTDLGNLSSNVKFSHGNDQIAATAKEADVVLLGFMPKQVDEVLKLPGLADALKGKSVISMLAGVPISQIQAALVAGSSGSKAANFNVSRIIPTLGVKIGESVTLIADPAEPTESKESAQLIHSLFELIGAPQHIPEALMDEATAIQSAVHALAIVAIDGATDASVADGLPRSTALGLIAASLQSAAGLISKGPYSPESLKAGMSTPGGITLNALVQLNAKATPGITESVRGAVKYTKSMNE